MIDCRKLIVLTFLILPLGACNLLPVAEPSSLPEIPVEELVVETLVSEANDLGNIDIEGAGDLQLIANPDTDQITSDNLSEKLSEIIVAEPVTPTIAMTPNRVVERAINDYLQNRRTLIRILSERSNTWFPMIEKVFEEEGIPDELKYIALGESGLRNTVGSSAGAVGMWQFMPATGRSSGLEINSWIDERMDPEKATRAAAIHLKALYESYNQNWHLTLAGYNCSYRCISRAVRQAGGSINTPPSFWEIYQYLPKETRDFVPKFIAISLLVSNPEMYGISVEDIGQEFSYDIVEINGMLSLEDAAMLSGTDLASIKSLNPSVRRNTLPDYDTPFELKIPLGTYDRFVAAFNNLPESSKVSPTEYIIRSGDTLDRIAKQFDTTVDELQATNQISGHLIFPNQKIFIPGAGVSTEITIASTERTFVQFGESKYRPIKLTEEFQLVEQAGSTEEQILMAVSLSSEIEDEMLIPTIYKVRRGDTLSQISERFDISVRDIQQWNNLNGTMIGIDQELTIHTLASAPTIISIYKVQRGDNLGMIARRFGTTVDSLKSLNGLNSNLIFPGQDLQVN